MKDDVVRYIQQTHIYHFANIENFSMEQIPNLTLAIKKFYSYISFESLVGDVFIYCVSEEQEKDMSTTDFIKVDPIENLSNVFCLEQRSRAALFVYSEEGYFYVKYLLVDEASLQLEMMSTLVYRLSNKKESFLFGGDAIELLKPPGRSESLFAEANFKTLEESLEDYRVNNASRSSCYILKGIWEDEKRVVFKNKPESTMRDSLCQHISTTLRSVAQVRPEQIVDQSHPVDLKVTFKQSNRVALIEIKWLGASRTSSGKLTTYTNARAEEGAKQLNDYIEENKDFSPLEECHGYLVVFDGRRKKYDGTPSNAELTYYRTKKLEFKMPYHEQRHDFAIPVRLFMEPKLTA